MTGLGVIGGEDSSREDATGFSRVKLQFQPTKTSTPLIHPKLQLGARLEVGNRNRFNGFSLIAF